jgi:hypothetical protein
MAFRPPHLALLVALLALLAAQPASCWSDDNIRDFASAAYAKSPTPCQENLTEQLNSVLNQTPDIELFKAFYNRSDCRGFIWASYHYFQLNDPKVACLRFYQRVHEWWGEWNWKFEDCGVSFSKADADRLIEDYANGYWAKSLILVTPLGDSYTPYLTGQGNLDQTQDNQDQAGGGGLPDFSAGKYLVWETWFFMPNWAVLELFLLLFSMVIAHKFSTTSLWDHSVAKDGDGFAVNKVRSISKELKYAFIMFGLFSVIFWIAWALT